MTSPKCSKCGHHPHSKKHKSACKKKYSPMRNGRRKPMFKIKCNTCGVFFLADGLKWKNCELHRHPPREKN